MIAIIKTEFWKVKRYHILLIGLIGMACSPLLQLFSQMVVVEEVRRSDFDFAALVEMTLWGDAQIFMPVIFTLIGGYLINREYTDDTLKNILTVPVSFRKLLVGKLLMVSLLGIILGAYSIVCVLIVSIIAGLPAINGFVLAHGLLSAAGLAVGIYVVVLPLIVIGSRKPGLFMSGSVIAFIAGYCCLFFKQGLLRSIYPFSAVLTMIGFDMSSYNGATEEGSVVLGLISLGVMMMITVALICFFGTPGEVQSGKKKKKNAGRGGRRK